MIERFLEIAFTPGVKAAQERYGSRGGYAGWQEEASGAFPDGLAEAEAEFVGRRDGFYVATVGEGGQPYAQFRGGPPGFLKVLDRRTLGYADFRGNAQYVSVGNLRHDDRAALILVDHATLGRLKIFARVAVKDADEDPGLVERLRVPGYRTRTERAVLLRVEAYDRNCPRHITPRYTADEVAAATEPLRRRVAELEAEVSRLRGAVE